MIKFSQIGMDFNDGQQQNPQDAHTRLIHRCIQLLRHASNCEEAECRQPSCLEMKNIMRHMVKCHQMSTGKCASCRSFIEMCQYHAIECNVNECPVPHCSTIKTYLKQQKLAQLTQ